MKIFYIYSILNIINGKIYVGKTKNLNKRWSHHKKHSSNIFLKRSIIKYGLQNFEFNILQIFENEDFAFQAEKYWISYFKSNDKLYGYNLTVGGEGATGYIRSEDSKRKQGDTFRKRGHKGCWFGKNLPQYLRDKISAAQKGKVISDYQKVLISQSKKGEKNPNAKLTNNDVILIKQYLKSGKTRKKISIIFNVSYAIIADIDRGYTWREVL